MGNLDLNVEATVCGLSGFDIDYITDSMRKCIIWPKPASDSGSNLPPILV